MCTGWDQSAHANAAAARERRRGMGEERRPAEEAEPEEPTADVLLVLVVVVGAAGAELALPLVPVGDTVSVVMVARELVPDTEVDDDVDVAEPDWEVLLSVLLVLAVELWLELALDEDVELDAVSADPDDELAAEGVAVEDPVGVADVDELCAEVSSEEGTAMADVSLATGEAKEPVIESMLTEVLSQSQRISGAGNAMI